jgi:hypothetical protein
MKDWYYVFRGYDTAYVDANDTLTLTMERARFFDIFVSTYNTADFDHEDGGSMFLRNVSICL